jgi:DNA-binding protein H-NS
MPDADSIDSGQLSPPLREYERRLIVEAVRSLIARYNLSSTEVFVNKAGSNRIQGASTLSPKYQDPRTGKTWCGRGRAPRWIEGEDRTLFLIAK